MVLEFKCSFRWSVTYYTAGQVRPSSGNMLCFLLPMVT